MEHVVDRRLVALDPERPIWDHFFLVAPLIVVGTREGDGYNMAPKHMVAPMGWQNYFGFVCTPGHRTYHNARRAGAFTVTFPRPSQVVLASMTAAARSDGPGHKPELAGLPTFPADVVEGRFLEDGYAFLECELDRTVDGMGENSLVIGRIVAAQVHADALRASDVDDQDLLFHAPLLAYLQPGRYAVIQKTFSFPFPADFRR
jgi:flavin reductase (DIM6/NTAB) family NADH-FMN oxidoreductase RutF